jgi:hypothetical protein
MSDTYQVCRYGTRQSKTGEHLVPSNIEVLAEFRTLPEARAAMWQAMQEGEGRCFIVLPEQDARRELQFV